MLIRGLRPANEGRRYLVTTSLTGWAQAWKRARALNCPIQFSGMFSKWLVVTFESSNNVLVCVLIFMFPDKYCIVHSV